MNRIDKNNRVYSTQGSILPFHNIGQYFVCNIRNKTLTNFKTIDIFNLFRNLISSKATRIHSNNFFIDAVHFSVRDDKIIRKLAAYVVLGVNQDGYKEVLGLYIGQNESSKYWLSILNELKNRGVKDILIMCADGLTGIKESISVAFPETEYQRCIVHQVRNTLKYVSYKDRKEYAKDLKTIYTAPSEERGYELMVEVTDKWNKSYPNSMKSWNSNWDVLTPIFKFSSEVRKVIYTTNAIESLNSTHKRLNRQRSVFPSDTALLKALYLATQIATKMGLSS